ncbi:MAG: hypothetical protein AAGA90_01880 [Actinomycetota bacterium]
MTRRNLHAPLRRLAALAALAVALVACGGDSDDPDTDAAVEAVDGEATTAWTDVDLERLVTIEIDGYTITNTNVSEFGNATVQYLEDSPSTTVALAGLVTFQACDPFLCTDLSAELDDQGRENARSLLPRVHIDNPDLVEELGPVELAGRQAFAIYFRSYVSDDDGQSTALSYRATTHDGANLITVQVSPDFASAGGLADSAEELAARMAPDDGAAVAESILAVLAGELG